MCHHDWNTFFFSNCQFLSFYPSVFTYQSHVLAVVSSDAVNTGMQTSLDMFISLLLGMHPEMEFLGCMVL